MYSVEKKSLDRRNLDLDRWPMLVYCDDHQVNSTVCHGNLNPSAASHAVTQSDTSTTCPTHCKTTRCTRQRTTNWPDKRNKVAWRDKTKQCDATIQSKRTRRNKATGRDAMKQRTRCNKATKHLTRRNKKATWRDKMQLNACSKQPGKPNNQPLFCNGRHFVLGLFYRWRSQFGKAAVEFGTIWEQFLKE
jgi:hypothetical protein